jgi:hypothetical protein
MFSAAPTIHVFGSSNNPCFRQLQQSMFQRVHWVEGS